MKQITLHDALTKTELSLKKAKQVLMTGVFISSATSVRPYSSGFKTNEELNKRIQSDTDTFTSNLENFVKLKEEVARKNLETKVMFQGKEYSITALLALKQTLDIRRLYVNRLRNQLNDASDHVATSKQEIERQLDNIPANEKTKVRSDLEKTQLVNIVTKNNMSAEETITQESNLVELLSEELDSILSYNNIKTFIDIDLG